MNTVYVKPRDGGRVRQPERGSKVMPDAGAFVPRNSYYERLILSEDVAICDPPKAKVPAAAPASQSAGAAAEPAPAEPPAAPSSEASGVFPAPARR